MNQTGRLLFFSILFSLLLVACDGGDKIQVSTGVEDNQNSVQDIKATATVSTPLAAEKIALHPCDLLTKKYIQSAFKKATAITIKSSKHTDRFCQASFELKDKIYGVLFTFLVIGHADETDLERVILTVKDRKIMKGVGDKAYYSAKNYGQVFALKGKNLIKVYVRVGSQTNKEIAAKIANGMLEKFSK